MPKMTATPAPPVAMMGAAGSACDETLTDDEYTLASAVLDALAERCCRDFTPSEIARFVKVDTQAVHNVLGALVADGHVSTTARGAWSRYRFVWG